MNVGPVITDLTIVDLIIQHTEGWKLGIAFFHKHITLIAALNLDTLFHSVNLRALHCSLTLLYESSSKGQLQVRLERTPHNRHRFTTGDLSATLLRFTPVY